MEGASWPTPAKVFYNKIVFDCNHFILAWGAEYLVIFAFQFCAQSGTILTWLIKSIMLFCQTELNYDTAYEQSSTKSWNVKNMVEGLRLKVHHLTKAFEQFNAILDRKMLKTSVIRLISKFAKESQLGQSCTIARNRLVAYNSRWIDKLLGFQYHK